MRCDCNVSVRPEAQSELGAKIEVKNMNSISGVRRALAHEVERQSGALARGEKLQQETRGWDDAAGSTFLMRTKEFAHDYRYFPDPDLVPVKTDVLLAEARARLPEMPEAKRARFVEQYRVSEYDAGVLANDLALARYFESAARGAQKPKNVTNWILNDLLSALSAAGLTISDCPVSPEALDQLVNLIESGKVSGKQGKGIFAEMFASGKSAVAIVQERGIEQLSDASVLETLCDEVITANPKPAADFRAGNSSVAEFPQGPGDEAFARQTRTRHLPGEILARKLRRSSGCPRRHESAQPLARTFRLRANKRVFLFPEMRSQPSHYNFVI